MAFAAGDWAEAETLCPVAAGVPQPMIKRPKRAIPAVLKCFINPR